VVKQKFIMVVWLGVFIFAMHVASPVLAQGGPEEMPADQNMDGHVVFDLGRLKAAHFVHAPELLARSAIVVDQASGRAILEKNSKAILPIASITKLMAAIVVLESGVDLSEIISVSKQNKVQGKSLHSRLHKNSEISRYDLLRLALMSSENKAIHTLANNHAGGFLRFIAAMNSKAREIGMRQTRFVEATGISSGNTSTAEDLVKLISAAEKFPLIRELSTENDYTLQTERTSLHYLNSNGLVRDPSWDIVVQKTGTTTKAGRCVAMQARIAGRVVIFVLLNGKGKLSRLKDAAKLRAWMENDIPLFAAANL